MIVEVSQFRLVPGVEEDAFLEAANETQAGFLQRQPGFHSRLLLRNEDGSWMDIVRFESMESAQAAFAAFPAEPSAQAFEKMLDVSTVAMSHWVEARSW